MAAEIIPFRINRQDDGELRISGWKTQGCIPAWRDQQISQVLRLPIEQILPLTRRAPKKWTKRKQLEPAT